MIVSLCGFMGAGKSTIGKHLARITGYPFIDLDHYIEKRVGMSIPEFFKREGEEAFRAEELASLQEILEGDLSGEDKKGKNLILSLGGGTVTREACATLVRENTRCIYLYCKKEELARRVKRNTAQRPILQGKTDKELEEHIGNLMKQRESAYQSCAHTTIDTGNGKIQDVMTKILETL